MLSEFLQFGYLGLLGLLITLCYKIVALTETRNRALRHTLTLLILFAVIAFSGGGAGYIWASKELEVVQKKESLANIKKGQISEIRKAYEAEITPLQEGLANAVSSLQISGYDSRSRDEYLQQIERIEALIQMRKQALANEISAIQSVFESEAPKT